MTDAKHKYRYINGKPRNIGGGRLSEEEAEKMAAQVRSTRVTGATKNGKIRRSAWIGNSMGDILQSKK